MASLRHAQEDVDTIADSGLDDARAPTPVEAPPPAVQPGPIPQRTRDRVLVPLIALTVLALQVAWLALLAYALVRLLR